MFETTEWALVGVALATALFHTLIPDHWLPFVLVGRARGWSPARTAAVSGASALIHIVLSIALGLFAVAAGLTASRAIGETLELAGAWMLAVFGLAYALWAWRKGGHFHPGGAAVHGEAGGGSCDGREGDRNPEHLHYHADGGLIAQRKPGARWLAVIVGANPCVLVLPMIFAAAERGALAVTVVTAAYALPTMALMVGMSALGVAGAQRLRLPLAARHAEVASGLLVALLGALVGILHR